MKAVEPFMQELSKDRPVTLRKKAYQILKQKIISGVLAPGSLLSESELAVSIGVSKTPIREALSQLEYDKLVSPIPRKGYLVTTITLRDIQEIFEIRLILERAATVLAAERITDDEIASLERYLDLNFDPSEQESFYEYIQSNKEFHLEIARASHNSRLIEHLVRVFIDAQRLQYMDLSIGESSWAWQRDHERIIEALRKHDKAAAAVAVEEALEEARTRLLSV
jgi:DNA-binding GntR family transcriptional regulator